MPLSREVTVLVVVDWSFGTDADTSEYWDVTDYIVKGTYKVSWGRDQARSTAPAKVETQEFVLNNQSGRFNNASGPLAGLVNRGPDTSSALRHESDITIDDLTGITLDGEDWTLDDPEFVTIFYGYVDQAPQTIGQLKTVAINSLGMLEFFTNRKITLPLMENTRVDLILHAICDQLGIVQERRFFDEGDVTIDYFWMADERPIVILPKLLATEGPGAALFVSGGGDMHFQGRQYRVNNYRSTTVQWYLYDKFVSSAPFRNPIYHNPTTTFNQNPDEVWNKVVTSTNIRELSTLGQRWNYGQQIVLGADQEMTIWATFNNPVKNAVVPVELTDYQLSTGSIASISLTATSGTRIGITITAGGGGATIIGPSGQESDGIYIRAQELAIVATPSIESTVDVDFSLARFQERSLSLDLWPEINPNIAQDIVNAIARRYKEPRDQLQLTIHNVDADSALFILRSQISDRIHVTVTAQGINHEYFIESKTIQSLGNGLVSCTLGCELITDEAAFRFGVDTFGNNVFG